MSSSVVNTDSGLVTAKLSPMATVGFIVGTNIGAGILALSYSARNAGFLPLLVCLIITCLMCTITMLYVTESCLRTKGNHQLTGLTARYLGKAGSWLLFFGIAANSYGALTAYMSGSGKILEAFFGEMGLTRTMGSLIFFVPAVVVMYVGLAAIGVAQKVISIGMMAVITILVFATFVNVDTDVAHLTVANWSLIVPIFNLAVFIFGAQFLVPELVRGNLETVEKLPKLIVIGMAITLLIVAVVPASIIALVGLDNISEVATTAWGSKLGQWAFWIANIFALTAMLTSYWGLGGALFSNIFDHFQLGSETNKLRRILVLVAVAVPPFFFNYFGMGGFVNALYFAGTFGGVLMGVIPMILLRRSRISGDQSPGFVCGWYANPIIQNVIMATFIFSAVYAVAAQFGLLPKSW